MSEQHVPVLVAQRVIIKFLEKEGVQPAEILTRLQKQFGEECLSRTRVFAWCKSFKEGRERVANEPHNRRPRTSITQANIDRVRDLINDNRRITVPEIAQQLHVSVGSVHSIIRNTLQFHKVTARWVPRMLSEEKKLARVHVATQLLARYEREGDDFLKSIVTTDETWVHFFNPESQQQAKEWRHPSSPRPKRTRQLRSAGKVMATFFWDWKGVIHVDFLQQGRTVTAEYYSSLLVGEVKPKIRSKRRKSQRTVCFLQDNARPHTAMQTMDTIRKLKWDLLPHPPYSPDLAPSDYHLFGTLKADLQGRRYESNADVIKSVQEWVHAQPNSFFEKGIKKLPERWQKCIDFNGEYFEF